MSGFRAPKILPSLPTLNKKENKMIKGIDVSHYTKGANLAAAKADGVEFVFAKATDGAGAVDPEFHNFRAEAKANGLLFGAYHFLRFDYDRQKQTDLFLKALDGARGEIQPVVDVEWDTHSQFYGEGKVMDDEAAMRARQVLESLVSAGYNPLVYTNFYFFTGFKNTKQFADFPLWISNYQAKDLSQVKIPAPWKQATFWQYKGDVPAYGVDKMDFNYFLGTRDELNAITKQ